MWKGHFSKKSRGVAYTIIRKKMVGLPVHAILRILSRILKLRVGMHPLSKWEMFAIHYEVRMPLSFTGFMHGSPALN
jgi:hypothetical protein